MSAAGSPATVTPPGATADSYVRRRTRRGVVVRALRDRSAELLRLYAGMNHSLEQILGDYTDTELQVLADFLSRTAAAGGDATGDLAAE
jgi:hypothetical protein